MLLIVLRKMLRNKWLVICLLIGSILAVAMVSSIPEYTDAIFQRMLIKDMENYQTESNTFPGKYNVRVNLANFDMEDRIAAYTEVFKEKVPSMAKAYEVPIQTTNIRIQTMNMKIAPEVAGSNDNRSRMLTLDGLYDVENHVKIIKGRMFSTEPVNGAYEVIVSEKAMQDWNLQLDETYIITDPKVIDAFESIDKQVPKIKIVGVFGMKTSNDPYWSKGLDNFTNNFIMDYSLFHKELVDTNFRYVYVAEWNYAFDYHKIYNNNLKNIIEQYDSQNNWVMENYKMSTTITMPVVDDLLRDYINEEKNLKITLLVLQVPILIMLAFYIFMVSQLIIEHDKNEIAVFKSRGASKTQIFLTYLLESIILSVIALIVGPPLGLLLCKILGSSNGFLEFIQRTGINVHLNVNAYLYSLCAVVFFIIMMLIPAIVSSRTNIVEHKRKKSAISRLPVWQKYFIDIILLAISGYGLYIYKFKQKSISIPGLEDNSMGMDPGLFLICTIFIIGCGLLFLRLYPYLIRLIFWIGRRIWTPVFYASFIQVGRSGGKEQFIMLFLVITLSVGIFSANTARTINNNIESKEKYMVGADIVMSEEWESSLSDAAVAALQNAESESDIAEAMSQVSSYQEPPFTPYTKLSDMDVVTKVYRDDTMTAKVGNSSEWLTRKVTVMGIISDEFGKAAWMRNDLLPVHWYNYLNLLASSPDAMLLSSSFKEKYPNIAEGDTVYIQVSSQSDPVVGRVVAFVDYWPGFNPKSEKPPQQETDTRTGQQTMVVENPYLIVTNYSYLKDSVIEQLPYQIWMKRSDGADVQKVYEEIEKMNVNINLWKDVSVNLVEKKNDPSLMGTNGSLTLGFIVTLIISFIGFLIYWILSIKGRILQFGIFRAMGLTLKKVIGMLVCEQVLISGVALFMGITIGGITSELFVPLLKVIYSATEQILPFSVVRSPADYLRIYTFAGLMLISGLAVLIGLVARININQALKLGED